MGASLSHNNKLCLLGLHTTRPECFCSFLYLARQTGLMRLVIRRGVRKLARLGLAEFRSGLMNEDGEVAGSGYRITSLGQEYAIKYREEGLRLIIERGSSYTKLYPTSP